jgi:hypothetical protein
MDIIYLFIAGIVLFVLGVLMKVGWLNFLIDRYEGFQKAIRRKKFRVDREGVSKYYSILFFVLGGLLMIVAIFGFIFPDGYKSISIWIYLALLVIGISGILYLNISNRFIKPLENS